MSNYTKTTDFEAKDSLPTGDAEKIIRGADFETEFDNIATAIATKADTAGPTFTGTVTIPTAAVTTLSLGGTTVTSTAAEVNLLDGVTATTAELNILDGVTATAAELNTLDGITATTAELNTLDGFTGTFEDLNYAKTLRASGVTGDEFDILDGLTATAAELNILDGATVTTAELNLLDGVTATTAELNILDGVTSTAAELNILDGVTSTAAELNLVDGSTAGTVVNSKAVVYGATGEVNATTLQVGGVAITSTPAELNLLDGATVTTAEINILDGVTATAAELNLLDGVTATTAELNILDGVTSTAAELNILDGVTADATELNKLDGVTATTSELNYVDVTTLGVVEASKAVTADANADVLFGDNDKLKFGAGSDLQIYHDGSSSYIVDNGTGNLQIDASDFRVRKPDGSEAMIHANADGAVKLFYDGGATPKLATTSTGIDVTGVVEATGYLAVEGTSGNTGTGTDRWIGGDGTAGTWFYNVPTGSNHYFAVNNTNVLGINSTGIDVTGTVAADGLTVEGTTLLNNGTNSTHLTLTGTTNRGLTISTTNPAGQNDAGAIYDAQDTEGGGVGSHEFRVGGESKLLIAAGGDISFYEDTGTTAKLFWDASAESLGIGTSSPDTQLTLYKASTNADVNYAKMRMDSWGGSTGKLKSIAWDDNGSPVAAIGAEYDGAKTNIHFHSQYNGGFKGTSERTMSIMGNGKVGIGTSSPSSILTAVSGASADETVLTIANDYSTADAAGHASGLMFQLYRSYASSLNDAAFIKAEKEQAWDASGDRDSALTFGTRSGGTEPTERMRIDSSGNVQIKSGNELQLYRADNGVAVDLYNGGSGVGLVLDDNNGDGFQFKFAGSEKMRIDSSGNLLVGTTTSPSGSGGLSVSNRVTVGSQSVLNGFGAEDVSGFFYSGGSSGGFTAINSDSGNACLYLSLTSSATTTSLVNFSDTGTAVGSITTNGTTTSYNTSSDQRLKENIVDAPSASDDIDAIQVRSFDWKADGSHQKYGMVAQELQTVAPEAVSQGATEEDMMGVDYSKLVPMLVKEIQSLRARVAQLETN